MISNFSDLQRFCSSFYSQRGQFILFRFGCEVEQDTIKARSDMPLIDNLGTTNVAEVIKEVACYISSKDQGM
tara:strand:- start:586 stop:801 length:216 start_codon:yes stop_codon:yes gene_type:complete